MNSSGVKSMSDVIFWDQDSRPALYLKKFFFVARFGINGEKVGNVTECRIP